jgi:predicted metalloprotease
MSKIAKRLSSFIALTVASVGIASSVATGDASAMNPHQTTLVGTVNLVYWDLDYFWRWALNNNARYVSPAVGYYSSTTYKAACGGTIADYTIMAYCSNVQRPEIWIHSGVNQDKVNRLGDNAAGFFVAHEFGHHIANVLGLSNSFRSVRGRELYADCMAGVFTRWEYDRGRFDSRDYWEGVWSIDDRFPNEGGTNGYPLKADRKAWYEWGFTTYNITNCAQAVYQ